ncbi:hypothetical protein FHT77_003791 [Rhizobium sp. BK181]|nr:hypothetical protein [Rhizobium sp. BK181]MBB3317899.1 hypothetical protein [Rhizobium sp. BK181]
MSAGKRPSQTGTAPKRRHKFNPKREPRPEVLARANHTVAWAAAWVVVGFLVIATAARFLF